MQTHSLQIPLDQTELDRLDDFLERLDPPTMSLEMLDGFFAALICGPQAARPSDYLPRVLGDEPAFADADEASEILGLLMRHWNAIASTLATTLQKDDVYLPIMFEDKDGVVRGNDWADGFMQGVDFFPGSWSDLIDSDEFGGAILPMMMLYHEHDDDPGTRTPHIAPDKRQDLIMSMIAGLTHIYRYFAEQRRPSLQSPVRRQNAKVGRNEKCPCGSGQKFKHCCAVDPGALH